MAVLFALLGLLFGSFTNVLISRTHDGESWLKGRSHCDHCHKQLKWYELIPVVSYVIQGGRCRHCKKSIPAQYPLVEGAMAVLFVSLYLHWQGQPNAWITLAISCLIAILLVADFVYDWRWHQLPDQFSIPAIIAAFALLIIAGIHGQLSWGMVGWRMVGAVAAGGFLAVLWGVSGGRWMGDGDIRLGILIGLLLPWQQLVLALFMAFNLGAIYALGLIARKGRAMTDRIAFGPFLILGLFIAYWWGAQIVSWYLNLPFHFN